MLVTGVPLGLPWTVALFVLGGFVPSLAGVFLTWRNSGIVGLRTLWKRLTQLRIGVARYLAVLPVVVLGTAEQIVIGRLLANTIDLALFLTQPGMAVPRIILGLLSGGLGWHCC